MRRGRHLYDQEVQAGSVEANNSRKVEAVPDRLQDLAEFEEDLKAGQLQDALREMILAYRLQKTGLTKGG